MLLNLKSDIREKSLCLAIIFVLETIVIGFFVGLSYLLEGYFVNIFTLFGIIVLVLAWFMFSFILYIGKYEVGK